MPYVLQCFFCSQNLIIVNHSKLCMISGNCFSYSFPVLPGPTKRWFAGIHAPISPQLKTLGRPLQISAVTSLCASVCSGTLPCRSNYPGLPKLTFLSPQLRESSGLCLDFLCAVVWNLSPGSKLKQS